MDPPGELEEDELTEFEAKKRFLVNHSGFPIDEKTWSKMFQFCTSRFKSYQAPILALLSTTPTSRVSV